jgi:16S rRNA (adenine1518-N6/adenine1519-N6)-dimethyltransferase
VVHLDALPEPRFPADPRILGPDVEALLTEAGIPATERAERVSLEGFCRLSRLVAAARAGHTG